MLALVGVGLLGGCLVCGGIGYAGFQNASQASGREARGIFADLRERRFDRAHARMSTSYRASHDPSAFQSEVEAIPALGAHRAATLERRSETNGHAMFDGHLDTASGPVPVRVRLTHERGSAWRVDAITVEDRVIGTE